MSTSVTLNGSSYTIPATGETRWGTNVSNYLIAISTGVLQKTGGAFTLTADVDFGATYGLKSAYYKSRGTVSTAGILRLANAEAVGWRNAANSANLQLKVNSSNILEFDGNPIVTLALGSADTVLRMNSGGTAYGFAKILDANVDSAAAVALSKLAAVTASRALVSDGSGVVSAATTTATQIGYLSAATGTTGTASTNLVFSTSPTLVTPTLGVATATSINKVALTAPATGSTLTIADGKTLTVSNTLTFTGTDSSSAAFGAGGTVAYTGDKLSVFAATTSSELAGVISDETGTGSLVFANTPTLVTPVLGVATATSINKVALTAPATGSTLTVADGKTLTASNTLTFTGTDGSSVAFGTGGTATYTANKLSVFAATSSSELAGVISDETGTGSLVFADTPTLVTPVLGVATATSINKVALTAPATSATLTIADGKTLTASNTLTFTGTDGTSFAFPSSSSTVMTLASTDTVTGVKTFGDGKLVLSGATSGASTLKAPAIASTYVHTLPAATATLVGTDTAQVLTEKDFDGGTASNTSRLTVPKATTATLSGLTRKQGTVVYDTSLGVLQYDTGAALNTIATNSAATATSAGIVTSFVPTIASSVKAVASTNYTVLDNDGYHTILVTTGASQRTITLPTAADNAGRYLWIQKADTGAGSVLIDGEGAETIDGAANLLLPRAYDSATLIGTGTGWAIVGLNTTVAAIYNTAAGATLSDGTVIDFGTLVLDTHSAVTTGASWKFTAPMAGLYQVSTFIQSTNRSYTAGDFFGVRLAVNGTETHRLSIQEIEASATMYKNWGGSILLNMATSDYVNVQFQASTGSVVMNNEAKTNYVSIVRVSR